MKIFDCIKNKEKFTSIALAYLLCFSGLSYFINTLTEEVLGKGFSLDSIALYGLLILLVGFACLRNLSSISYVGAIVAFFFIFSYIVTLIAFPQNHLYMWTSFADYLGNPFYVLFFYSFTALLLAINLKDIDHLFGWLTFFSYVIIILAGIRFLLGIEDAEGDGSPYMTFAYNVLLPVTFLLLNNFRKFRLIPFLFSIIGLIELFLIGCRGALVSCLAALALYVFFFGKLNVKVRLVSSLLLLITVLFVFFYFEETMAGIGKIADALDFDSRTLDYILRGNFLDDSGRGDIYKEILNSVTLFGKGFYGDRLVLSQGRYTHNVLLELLSAYGLLFGVVVIGAYVLMLLCAFVKSDEKSSFLISVLLSVGLFKLMFSSSFLGQEPAFFALIGICLATIFHRKRRKKEMEQDDSLVEDAVFADENRRKKCKIFK